MPAYIIFTREKLRDPAEMEKYKGKVPNSFPGHAVTPLVRYGRYEVLEGPGIEGAVVLQFPTFDEAKAWYNSPAYQEAVKHRFLAADYRAVIVEGM